MKGFTCIVIANIIGALLMVHPGFAQTVHIVGDNIGWTVPSIGSAAYVNWASGKTFSVGDILVFNFATNNHDVQEVPRASFDECTSDNPIGDVILNGPANVTLTSAGDHYYICTIGRHCLAGQNLAISVVSRTTPGAASPTSTTPSPMSNPAGGPMIPPPPSSSSSTAVFASLSFTLASIAILAAFFN